jgi:hypothetical protein
MGIDFPQRYSSFSVMAGLVPAIHVLATKEVVDARVEPTAVRFDFGGRCA